MKARIKELAQAAGAVFVEPSTDFFGEQHPGGALTTNFDIEKFGLLLTQEIVSKFEVEGSDFYYNEPNDYGCVTVKFFTGKGDPWHEFNAGELQSLYADGEVRGNGRYRLNKEFAEYLLGTIK